MMPTIWEGWQWPQTSKLCYFSMNQLPMQLSGVSTKHSKLIRLLKNRVTSFWDMDTWLYPTRKRFLSLEGRRGKRWDLVWEMWPMICLLTIQWNLPWVGSSSIELWSLIQLNLSAFDSCSSILPGPELMLALKLSRWCIVFLPPPLIWSDGSPPGFEPRLAGDTGGLGSSKGSISLIAPHRRRESPGIASP